MAEDEKPDVAPDQEGFWLRQGGAYRNPPVWRQALRKNAIRIPVNFTTSTSRPLYVYDLIEFGPAGEIDTQVLGWKSDLLKAAEEYIPEGVTSALGNFFSEGFLDAFSDDSSFFNVSGEPEVKQYLRDQLEKDGLDALTLPSQVGSKWTEIDEMVINIEPAFQSKMALQTALLDFMGYVAWNWQHSGWLIFSVLGGEGQGISTEHITEGMTFQDALNLPYSTLTSFAGSSWEGANDDASDMGSQQPWGIRGAVGDKINFTKLNLMAGEASQSRESAIVTEEDLPQAGKYFKMTLEEFVKATGLDARALTQGKFSEGHKVSTIQIVEQLSAWGVDDEIPSKRAHHRGKYFGEVTVKDIIAYNYFYINEKNAQEAFEPAAERQAIIDKIKNATGEEEEKLKKELDALLKKQREACINVGDQGHFTRKDADLSDLIFSEKCILASNLDFLSQANRFRFERTKKYDRIEMCTGSPTGFINKLYMQKGYLEFAHLVTNLQLSHLIPAYRFYKVIYDAKGCPVREIEISFPQKTDISSLLKPGNHGRGQVGVRNIEWAYISDKPSTVRNDITATVTLFFQNFNGLVEWRQVPDGSGDTFRYLDLLRRPPKDRNKIAKAQQAARRKGAYQKGECGHQQETDAASETEPSQTGPNATSGKNPVPDELAEPITGPATCDEDDTSYEYYEIKMVVGWSPPKARIPNDTAENLVRKGVSNNVIPLFLSLIDHDFKIGEDGVFELSLTYRARIEGLFSDGRANVLATSQSVAARERINKDLCLAKLKCDEDEIKRLKKEVQQNKEINKAWLGDSLLSELLQGTGDHAGKTQIYTAIIDNQAIVDAQYHVEEIPLSYENTNILGPGKGAGFAALGNQAGEEVEVVLGNLMKETLGYMASVQGAQKGWETALNEGVLLESQVALERRHLDKASRDQAWAEAQDRAQDQNWDAVEDAIKEGAEQADWMPSRMASVALGHASSVLGIASMLPGPLAGLGGLAGEAAGYVSTYGKKLADLEDYVSEPTKFAAETAAAQGADFYPLNFMYAGDLIEIATKHALDFMGNSPDINKVGFTPCATKNVKVLLGPLSFVTWPPPGNKPKMIDVNIADIPISLKTWSAWFKKKITDQDRDTYNLLSFIRDLVQECVIDVLRADCFQGTIAQKINLKTGLISLPMPESGLSPIEERINSTALVPSGKSTAGPWNHNETPKQNMLPLTFVNPQQPLAQVDVWAASEEMFHYLYIYGESAFAAANMTGDFDEDLSRGIYHLYMGAEKGLVKSINFSKTDQPYLREARFEQDALNPLAELAAVYKAQVKMVGSTMFFPGQYVFINMQPVGHDLGHPGDQDSPANQLGLGGYHLVTKVTNEITSDNQFETTLECLWDNSGDGQSRLSAGAQTTVDSCPESGTTGPSVDPSSVNVPAGADLETPTGPPAE